MQEISLTTYWGGTPAPPPSSFAFHRSITIDKTKVPNTDQTDFPILFNGTYSYLKTVANGGGVQSNSGYDIFFFSDAALTVQLKWEIEKYVPTTGEVIFWVKVPTVTTAVDTVIYIAYGDATKVTFQGDSVNVWNSGYEAVYHLTNGSVLSANDSTSNANNGSLGTFGPDPAAGYLDGGALGISGNSPNINLGAGASLNISGSVALSAWTNFTNVGVLQNIICKGGEDYRLRLNGQDIAVGSYDGINDHQAVYSSSIATGAWHYLSGGYNGTAWVLFYDGVQVASSTDAVGAISGAFNTRLMSNDAGTQRFMQGYLDEVRISSVFRNADWTATEYNNQSSPSTFYSISAPL